MVGYRELEVPPFGDGMRLDRFLAVYFHDRSRSWMNRGVREGLVRGPDERPLRPACRVRAGDTLRLYLPEIAPSAGAPPFPDVLYEDDRVIAIDKPAGLLTHPAGTRFAWAVISMAKQRWGSERVDLVHRLDRDTSGVLVLARGARHAVALRQLLGVHGLGVRQQLHAVHAHVHGDDDQHEQGQHHPVADGGVDQHGGRCARRAGAPGRCRRRGTCP
jgi:23S rRNA-/tRNA-specific pseudouridylate synthase